ncbi:uncharacterized protein LOC104430248 [Eucalyptus grandis]|uniref:uncharacterized protein LOC104430248 n=1 Tax=Eucalyptus grandis TaxID=71139 RepID=UPI00192EC109|nr:uncharacterized protein LOC104430248 [Eucalyptus grandis]
MAPYSRRSSVLLPDLVLPCSRPHLRSPPDLVLPCSRPHLRSPLDLVLRPHSERPFSVASFSSGSSVALFSTTPLFSSRSVAPLFQTKEVSMLIFNESEGLMRMQGVVFEDKPVPIFSNTPHSSGD